jgi:hypothetical protein
MRQIELEAVLPIKQVTQRPEYFNIQLLLGATTSTDQVLMELGLSEVVLSHSIVEVRVPDKLHLLQQVQRPVYRGDVDLGELLGDAAMHSFSRDVSLERFDSVEYQLTLRSHAQAVLPKHLGKLTHRTSPKPVTKVPAV